MAAETTDPVVQIIYRDEEDVGRFAVGNCGTNKQLDTKKCEDGFHAIFPDTGYFAG